MSLDFRIFVSPELNIRNFAIFQKDLSRVTFDRKTNEVNSFRCSSLVCFVFGMIFIVVKLPIFF